MQVLLGRATAEFIVDIDLGSEGSGNKISRRQVELIQSFFPNCIHIENVIVRVLSTFVAGYKYSLVIFIFCSYSVSLWKWMNLDYSLFRQL